MSTYRFPVFRKYANNRSFFKINSLIEFEEIQKVGNKCFFHKIKAKILPERTLIMDLLEMKNNAWIPCSLKEYENEKKSCTITNSIDS